MVSRKAFASLAAAVWIALPLAAQSPQSGLTAFENVAVPMADRVEVSRLVDAGVVSIDGARGVVVTVAGELRGRAAHEGKIGVMLIPDLPFFTDLYRNRSVLLSAAEFTANVASGDSGFFTSKSKYAEAGFSRYRVLVFNTTGAPVSANIYLYQSRS
ncbi:MAG TPA: hypothetical protein VGQ32_07885 [Thermoanaerobaculia bacterium]|jgi:hypothetical protein|nr:hypothetical protein [Thermoanaerobaculia bacterium]